MTRIATAVTAAVGRGVERALTGRAALAYYRKVLTSTTDPEGRVQVILAAMRVAIGLDDRAAIAELSASWATSPGGIWRNEVVGLCKELVNAGRTAEAATFAGAEVERHRTAMSLYLWARCSEGTDDAPGRYALAIERADREGARHIVDAARRRRAILLARRWETMPEALQEATTIELAATPPRERLAVARILLGSPSRFVRATAIGVLDELVTTERRDRSLAAQALRAAAAFADERGAALTPLETERLTALFGRPFAQAAAPGARAAMLALDTMLRASPDAFEDALATVDATDPALAALHARARALASGGEDPGAVPVAGTKIAHRILDAAAALRAGEGARAAEVLRELAPIAPAPRALLGVAHAAILQEDPAPRDAAIALFTALLRAPTTVTPPRGWAALAQALAIAGAADLARLARHAAAAAREPGAVDALVLALAREGWALADRDPEAALAKLREAKRATARS